MNVANDIYFHEICDMFEEIRNTEEVPRKEKILKKYITSLRKHCDKFREIYGEGKESPFYSILRCLIPELDSARGSYGIQITSLGKIYAKVLHLPPDDALKLQSTSGMGSSKDYADIVYSVIKSRTIDDPTETTLVDINDKLDSIASGDRSMTEKTLRQLLDSTAGIEQKWFIRLLLKRLNLGLSAQKILSVIHPKAKQLYDRCTDLKKVCTAIESGDFISLLESISPFLYVQPMLCARLELDKLYDMMGSDTLYAETKMDGERFQLHMQGETFKYFSRNGKDYTNFFGSHHAEGNLTPLLVGLFEPFVKSVIFDGEMMVWDKEIETFRVKGENIDVKHLPIYGNLRPCFVVYDLLYLNGRSCIDMSYAERKAKLETCFKEQAGVLHFGKYTKLCTVQHFIDIFNNALDANEEGVVVKLQRSVYKPHSRVGGWFKVKADYVNGLTSDMDMLIMGGYYNRSRKSIESYLVGVVDGKEDVSLHCVGKVALGLTADERNKLSSTLSAKMKRGIAPRMLRFGNQSPHVWIEPQDSIILQLKASELGQATSFATPFSLRFPRIEAIRSDKPWDECMTLAEYEAFYKGTHGVKKINKRNLDEQDLNGNVQKKKRQTKSSNSTTTVYSTTFNQNEIKVDSSIFEGFKFCILSHRKGSHTVVDLKKLAVKNGGTIVENPSPEDNMCICIAGDITCRVKELRDTGNYNIVSCNWLLDTAERKRLQLKPRDMISVTSEMKDQFKMLFDSYGDSYTDHVDVDELKNLFEDLEKVELPMLQKHEVAALEEELYKQNKSPNFFRNCTAFFYNEKEDKLLSHETTLAKLTFQWRGGTCPDPSGDGVKKIKYVFADLPSTDLNALEAWVLMSFQTRVLKVQVVSIDWIKDSDKKGKKFPVDKYLIKF